MTRFKLFLSFAFLFLSSISRADYVTQTTGHGPAVCIGQIPDHGYADITIGGMCGRWRGDFIGDSTAPHPGYVITWTTQAQGSVTVGPGAFTTAFICEGQPLTPYYMPCDPHYRQVQVSAGGTATAPFIPKAVVLRYLPFCPNTPGMTHLHQCTGASTPEDGSGFATVVIDDGNPAHALNLPNPPINAGDCFIDLSSYSAALAAQFVPPPGYTHGTRVVAVYTCPLVN